MMVILEFFIATSKIAKHKLERNSHCQR